MIQMRIQEILDRIKGGNVLRINSFGVMKIYYDNNAKEYREMNSTWFWSNDEELSKFIKQLSREIYFVEGELIEITFPKSEYEKLALDLIKTVGGLK